MIAGKIAGGIIGFLILENILDFGRGGSKKVV
jgi:hypothetical protein